jgi:hypothetical protein
LYCTGPLHPWLTRAYAESAPYPSGSILGQELFQSGIIPSDTDYRIYRDFGDIPGTILYILHVGFIKACLVNEVKICNFQFVLHVAQKMFDLES